METWTRHFAPSSRALCSRARRLALAGAIALVALRLSAQTAPPDALFVSLLPGTYRTNQALVLRSGEPDSRAVYAIARPDGTWHTEITYREPLRLTAFPGEERVYRVRVALVRGGERVDERELTIEIDRRPPASPSADPPGGVHATPLEVRFRADQGAAVYYAVNRDLLTEGRRWDGGPIRMDPTQGDQVLQYYATDDAGNQSAIRTDLYTLQPDQRPLTPRVAIVSPADGTFANLQMLYLVTEDVGTIRYTLDGTDPARSGTLYTEPRLLEYTGRLVLKIAAYPVGADRDPIVLERPFEVVPEAEQTLVVSAPSGVYAEDRSVVLLGEGGDVVYTLADESPVTNGMPYRGPIPVLGESGARRITVLRVRVRSAEGTWGQEYRYFYAVDRRTPPAPELVVVGRQPSGQPVTVHISKEPSATVRYTTNGEDPGVGAAVYTEPVRVVPTASGTVVFKAVAYSARGAASAVVARTLVFDTKPPDPPTMQVTQTESSSAVRIRLTAEMGSTLVQETAPSEEGLRVPTAASPVTDEVVVVDAPMGARQVFHFRFAAVDGAGNLSAPTAPIRVVVDKEPPECPAFLRELDGALLDMPRNLTAPADMPELYYEIRSDGSVPPDPTLASTPLAAGGVLSLPGQEGGLLRYTLKVILRDDVGNISDVYGPFVALVDRRKPVLPAIEGPADGSRVNTASAFLTLTGEPSGVRVAYSYTTDGSEPAVPTRTSPVVEGRLEIPGVEGQELSCTVLLLPVSSSGNLVGDLRRIRFVMDRKPPVTPEIRGPSAGERLPRSASVTIAGVGTSEEIWVSQRVTRADAEAESGPGDPVETGEPYNGPLSFDTEPGSEILVQVRAAAVDNAGNRSARDASLIFFIDKRPPGPVLAAGLPTTGTTREAVTITLSSDGERILYETTDDGSQPPPPSATSPRYVAPFLVSGREGEEVEYRIRARAVDGVGNVGPADLVHVFTVDRLAPAAPPEPSVAAVPDERGEDRYVLAWPELADREIYHRLLSDPAGVYQPYRGPFEVSAGPGEGAIEVESYAVDGAGNRSASVRSTLSAVRRLDPPVVLGADDGSVHRSDHVLTFGAAAGTIRYEISLDGTTPAAVTPDSPAAPGRLALTVPEGATLDVALRLRAFPTGGAAVASSETRFRMRIDKTPPEPPVASGIADGGYYRDLATARLLASEGTIYYSLGDREPQAVESDRYVDPIVLRVDPGQTQTFRVAAFTVDDAGNRSLGLTVWNVTLDDKVIYVAEEGSDRNPGTRDLPLRSLEQALRMSASSLRDEIHVALGTYPLARPLVVDQTVTVLGGYTSAWQSSGLGRKATVTASPGFPAGTPLVTLAGGSTRLSGLRFTHAPEEVPTLVSVRSGTHRMEDCSVFLTRGDERVGVDVGPGASLALVGGEMEADDGTNGAHLRSRGGTVTVSTTVFRGPRTAEVFAAVVLQQGARGTLTAVRIEPGGAQRTDAVMVSQASLRLIRSSAESGSAGAQGAAIRALAAEVEITESTVSGTPSGVYTFGVYTDQSAVTIDATKLGVAARSGATGIRARGGSLTVRRSEVRAGDTREFSYLVDMADTAAVFHTNVMLGARSGDSVVSLQQGGTADWFNNTLVAGTGSGLTAGFYLSGAGTNRIVNNILVRREADTGSAVVVLGGEKGLALQSNCLSGWSYLLSADSGSARSGRLVAASGQRITQVADLDARDGDRFGGPYHGNIREPYLRIFRVSKEEDFHLSAASAAVNAGVAVDVMGGPTQDMDGENRPAPDVGAEPAYDIGADELY